MDIDQYKLTVFCTVAETTSITRAAEILYLTQPAVSIHINALEDILGTRLINREQSGSDRLTTGGVAFYRRAKEILRLHALARKEIAGSNSRIKTDIKIGASDTFENHILPSVVSDLNKRFPDIRLSIEAGDARGITNLLLSGDLDIGITDDVPLKKKVAAEPLMMDELFVIVPPKHMWANLKRISIHSVAKRPLILREEGAGTRRIVDDMFASNGISSDNLKVPLVLTSAVAICDAVESGLGVSFASKWEIRTEVRHKRLVPLVLYEGDLKNRFYLVTIRDAMQSGRTKAVIDYLRSYPYDLKCRFNSPDTSTRRSKKKLAVQTNQPGYDPDRILSIQS